MSIPLIQDISRRNDLLRVTAWTLLGVVIACSLLRIIGQDPTEFQALDFGAYYRAGTAISTRESPYFIDSHGPCGSFVYAPGYAYLFVPLALFDYLWAGALWTALNWVLAYFCVVGSWRLVNGDRPGELRAWEIGLLALLPLIASYNTNFREGQVGVLMASLCIGAALCQRAGRALPGGMLLAFAAGLKIVPGVLFFLLLFRRDWRGILGAIFGTGILIGLPVLHVGLTASIQMHLDWVHHCKTTQIPVQTIRQENQSLLGELARLPWISNGVHLHSLDNLHVLERCYGPLLVALTLTLTGAFAWSRWGSARSLSPPQSRRRELLEFAVVLVFLTLLHPRGWRCNFIVLTLPCMMLADWVIRQERGSRWAFTALAMFLLVGALPKLYHGEPAWSLGHWLYQGKDFWGVFGVGLACLAKLRLDTMLQKKHVAYRTKILVEGREVVCS